MSGSGLSSRPAAASSSASSPAAGRPRPKPPDQGAVAEEAGDAPRVDDRPRLQRDDAVGADHLVHLLGHVDDGEAAFAQPAHRLEHLGAAGGVQHRGRLVEHQGSARHGEDAGERRALLLAAGEQVRLPGLELRQPEPLEHLVDPGADRLRRPRQVLEAERHVVLHALRHELVLRVLEEHADVAARRHAPVLGQEVVAAGERQGGPGGALQAAEQTGERGLARTVGAHDRDELAGGHGEIEPGERVRLRARIAVAEAADVEQWGGELRRSRSVRGRGGVRGSCGGRRHDRQSLPYRRGAPDVRAPTGAP